MLPQLLVAMSTNPSKHKQRGNTSADEQKGRKVPIGRTMDNFSKKKKEKKNGQIDHLKVVLNFHDCIAGYVTDSKGNSSVLLISGDYRRFHL